MKKIICDNFLRALGLAVLLLLGMAAHAVAANVKYAFDELAAEFSQKTGVGVKSVFASSRARAILQNHGYLLP